MNDMISQLQFYFSYPFVRYALIVGLLISLCSSLMGVTLVLKRYSFIGDGLSHVAFGAMAVATIFNLTDNTLLVLPVTIIAAILLLRTGQNAKMKGDAAIAMLSVGALAIGYLILNLFSTSANISGDVCSTLFGSTSILTLTQSEVILCIVLSVLVILLFVLFYNRIFAVTFDETFMRASGLNADRYNLLIAVVIAVIIVLGMNLVGSLLISALVIFPSLSAMRLMKHFKGVVICSAILSVVCAFIGILISILLSTPVGSTIVAADMIVFFLSCLIGTVATKRTAKLAVLALFCTVLISGCGNNGGKLSSQNKVADVVNQQIENNDANSTLTDDKTTTNSSPEQTDSTTVSQDLTDTTASSSPDETDSASTVDNTTKKEDSVDIDLTQMGSDMVYATVYQMMNEPEQYTGKTVRMSGQYYSTFYEPTSTNYFYVLIADAAACCSQGLEFIWDDGSHAYPDEYPDEASNVEVTGIFESYTETVDGFDYQYCRLKNASLTVLP